jgi:hypothetical protein
LKENAFRLTLSDPAFDVFVELAEGRWSACNNKGYRQHRLNEPSTLMGIIVIFHGDIFLGN